jgi:hypothetical protein
VTGIRPITARTAERYAELIANQINPYLGSVVLQRLKPIAIEQWHNTLRIQVTAARSIGNAHRLLSVALREAMRHDLVTKNVAELVRPPRVVADEVQIIGENSAHRIARQDAGPGHTAEDHRGAVLRAAPWRAACAALVGGRSRRWRPTCA